MARGRRFAKSGEEKKFEREKFGYEKTSKKVKFKIPKKTKKKGAK